MTPAEHQARLRELGLTQAKLAAMLGLSPNTVSRQFGGDWKMPPYVLAFMAAWEMLDEEQRDRLYVRLVGLVGATAEANRREGTQLIEWNGDLYTRKALAEKAGISKQLLHVRLKAGWDVGRAVTTPAGAYRPVELEWEGETHSVPSLARRHGLGVAVLRERLKLGWDLERALTTPVKKRKAA